MDFSAIIVGGSYWLDLVNTFHISNGEKQDILKRKETVLEWLVQSGLVSQGQVIEGLDLLTTRLIKLRQLFLHLLSDLVANEPIQKAFVDELDQLALSLNLTLAVGIKEERLYEEIRGATFQEDILYKLIHSFSDTYDTVPHDRIKQCQHDDCILYFTDLSKSGKRKWCKMETCGNRVKSSKFYASKKSK